MKEGMRSRLTIMPFNRPTAAPTASAAATPSHGSPVDLITVPAKQAARPIVAPTERSSPAVITTSVRPELMKNSSAAWRSTLTRLTTLRNAPLRTLRARPMTSTAATRMQQANQFRRKGGARRRGSAAAIMAFASERLPA